MIRTISGRSIKVLCKMRGLIDLPSQKKSHWYISGQGVVEASSACQGINAYRFRFSYQNLAPDQVLIGLRNSNHPRQNLAKFVAIMIAIHMRHPTLRLLPISLIPSLIRLFGPTIAKASTSHSYQTFLSSVCLHILTSSSESSGK